MLVWHVRVRMRACTSALPVSSMICRESASCLSFSPFSIVRCKSATCAPASAHTSEHACNGVVSSRESGGRRVPRAHATHARSHAPHATRTCTCTPCHTPDAHTARHVPDATRTRRMHTHPLVERGDHLLLPLAGGEPRPKVEGVHKGRLHLCPRARCRRMSGALRTERALWELGTRCVWLWLWAAPSARQSYGCAATCSHARTPRRSRAL